MHISRKLRRHAGLGAVVILSGLLGQYAPADEIYRNDFEDTNDPLTEWKINGVPPGVTDKTPGSTEHPADRFLGQFRNDRATLTLANLPAHERITVRFDLYVILSWDGNTSREGPDEWRILVDNALFFNTTFHHEQPDHSSHRQAYPDWYPGGVNRPRTGADENDTLGYGLDAVYIFDEENEVHVAFPHTSGTLVLEFTADAKGTPNDEFWGVDNIVIASGCASCDANCDGSVDLTDVEPFIDLILGGGEQCSACAGDTNGDGSVDPLDVEPFIGCLLG